MKKTKKEIEVVKVEEKVSEPITVIKVGLLTQEFGNGDMNTLRDKINEVIKSL
jgi:hypothetical protein